MTNRYSNCHSLGIFFAGLLFMLSGITLAATPEGAWEGSIDIPGTILEYSAEFIQDSTGAWTGSIDIPAQNAVDLPLSGIVASEDSLAFLIAGIPGEPTFRGAYSDDAKQLAGTFIQGGQTFPFSMKRLDAAVIEERDAELEASLQNIRAFIDTSLKEWSVPGLGIAIVKNDKVIMSEGFGLRNVKNSLPVTANTQFAIGSSTKAFTSCALAMLVDSGKVDWDKRVYEYLPKFRLKDPYITEHATVRDLVTHRIGLPRHDLMWYSAAFTREELFNRLKYLDFSKDFRTTFQYQNLMFMTAGYLAGQVAGMSWEDFVHTRILQPLGMTSANFSSDTMAAFPDHASGYREDDDTLVLMPYRTIDAIGPAGSINASVNEMANWVRLHLKRGEFDGRRLVSEAQMLDMHSPYVSLDRAGGQYHERQLMSYGLGWFIESYRGHYRVHHGGNIDGFSALVSFYPDDDFGMVILTNMNGTSVPSLVCHYVADLLLGLEPVDFSSRVRLAEQSGDSVKVDAKEAAADRVKDTKPSHALSAFIGEYEHPGYGLVKVSESDRKLHVALHGLESDLEHWHYDVFRLTDDLLGGDRALLSFNCSNAGDIEKLCLVLEPSLAPIEFTKLPDKGLSEPAYLAQFVGQYSLEEVTVTVEIQLNHLTVTVPGQPTYVLQASKKDEFDFRDLTGYSVAFDHAKDGSIAALKFKQPNGVFVAQRKSA